MTMYDFVLRFSGSMHFGWEKENSRKIGQYSTCACVTNVQICDKLEKFSQSKLK